MKLNFKKLAPIVLVHLFELVVLYFVVAWIINNGPAPYSLPAAILMVVCYMIYLVSSLFDDYKEYNKGDFDW
jgi:hypothetical protein